MVNDKSLNLVTVGYAKRALETGTRERKRMQLYASVMRELHVIVFTRQVEGFPDKQQDENLFLYATNTKTRIGMLWSAYRIGRKIIANRERDKWVISSQDPFETALVSRAVASRNRATNHVQLHGDVFNFKSYQKSWLQQLRVIYGKHVVKHSSCIRVVSERIKSSLESLGVLATAITILPIQSELEAFIQVGNHRVYQEKKPCSFLYVGRFSEEKNLFLMIKAFHRITNEFPSVTLTLLGSGPLKSVLETQVKESGLDGRVIFKAWSDDVSRVMASHDVLCLSSNHEGWGMVLLEAAAAGMPVITTDVGCAGEVIVNNENGRVISVGDVDGYAVAFRQYCEESPLVAKHGHRGSEISSQFILSESEYLQRMVDSYSSCLTPSPAILTGNGST